MPTKVLSMAASKTAEIGGYDVALISAIPNKFKCFFCNLLMRDPIQTCRGEMSCESCYVNAKGINSVCPIDGEPMEGDEFFRDKFASREILQLPCYCSYKNNGCPWRGVVKDIENHTSECMYKDESCKKCHSPVPRKEMDEHLKQLCRFRMVECPYCKVPFEGNSLQNHQASCHLKPMECPYTCGQQVSLKLLYGHVESCPKVQAGDNCPYKIVGCKYQPRNNADLRDHLQMANNEHAGYTVATVTVLQQSNETIKQDLLTEQTLRVELSRKVEGQSNDNRALATKIDQIQTELNKIQDESRSLEEKCNLSVVKVKEDLKEIDARTQHGNIHDINISLNDLHLKYRDTETRLQSRLPQQPSSLDGAVSSNYQNDLATVDRLESSSAFLGANIADLELKLQLLENTSYEGRQLWKVDNVAYRKSQATNGKVTALHSAPCFQKRGGYKYCLRLYLNGDGMGRGTHVSLFFVIMKSEYDALLKWPFTEKVTFRLINPNNPDENITESFIPEKDSSSFQRPTKDMNIAAGCPKFARQDKIQQFVVDDCFYVECMIGEQSSFP